MKFQPSIYQEKIIEWASNPEKKHGICQAVAGSGKSTTLKLVAIDLMKRGVSIDDIKVIVFGKQNQLDLVKKFGWQWTHSISTLHSIGYQMLASNLEQKLTVDSSKYQKIGREIGYLGTKKYAGKLMKNVAIESESQFLKLFNLARLHLSSFDLEDLEQIASEHTLDGILDFYSCSEAITEMSKIGLHYYSTMGVIDYSDMICLPIALSEASNHFKIIPNKFVLVDECQDLNAVQRELSFKLVGDNGRLLFVGDPNQAIFGFAGASCDSYEQIKTSANATELPLSICYRCPKSHIQLVKGFFPKIPIFPTIDAIDGVIEQIEPSEAIHEQNDLVICRKTAPLVGYCLKLIGQGIPAKVKGRDIGTQLTREIDAIWEYGQTLNLDGNLFKNLLSVIDQYYGFKQVQWNDLEYKDKLIEALSDRLDAIRVIYDGLISNFSLKGLKDKVKDLFVDGNAHVILCFFV